MGRFVNINRDPRAEFRAVSAPNADNVAITEGITGQLYIAILVALLVAMQMSGLERPSHYDIKSLDRERA